MLTTQHSRTDNLSTSHTTPVGGHPSGQASPGPYNELWVEPYGGMLLKWLTFFDDNDIALKGKEVCTLERSSTTNNEQKIKIFKELSLSSHQRNTSLGFIDNCILAGINKHCCLA